MGRTEQEDNCFGPTSPTPTPPASSIGTPTAVPATAIFALSARDASSGAPFADLATPLTLSVAYAADPAFDESGLQIYRRPTVSDTWTTAGIVSQTLDTANDLLVGQVITLGQFVVVHVTGHNSCSSGSAARNRSA